MISDELKNQIEVAIFNERLNDLSKLLNSLLRSNRSNTEYKIFASHCYRRTGQFKKALKVLEIHFKPMTWSYIPEVEFRRQIQALEILTFLGATRLSSLLIQEVPKNRAHLVLSRLALLSLNCGDYKKAHSYWQQVVEREKTKTSFLSRYSLVPMALCKASAGDWVTAVTMLKKLQRTLPEDAFFQNYVKRNLLICFILGKQADDAEKLGRELLSDTHPESKALYCGEVKMYYGASLILLGRLVEAKPYLDDAILLLHKPGNYSFIWILTLYWQGLLKFSTNKIYPAEWKRILVYPTPISKVYTREIEKQAGIFNRALVSPKHVDCKSISSKIHFDLETETAVINYGHASSEHRLGFNILDRALISLLLAGPYGISEHALFDILWKNDFSINQCDRRISQLIKRLRALKYPVRLRKGQVYLDESADVTCLWSSKKKVKGWNFLEKNPLFSRLDVQRFFSVSKTQALMICSHWMTEKTIKRNASGVYVRLSHA